jgi:uncharacterized protein
VENGDVKPFIKKFKTKNRYYIYDVNSNDLLGVNPVVYEIIDEYHQKNLDSVIERFKDAYPAHEIKENYALIERMGKERNYFSNNHPHITSGINSVETVQSALQSGLRQIVLESTNRCNLRCEYCAYSGKYLHSRTHGKNDMTFDIAKKALDFFIERADDNPGTGGTAITYYGGEPLLNFDLLKATIDYVTGAYKEKNPRFSLTTNGALLDKKGMIDFLVKNDIGVSVSLDGPEQIHDRYRRFMNKKPTFRRVLENLARIKENHPDYYARKISIIAVLAPPFDIEAVSNFFFKNNLFTEVQGRITIGLVDPVDTTFFTDFKLESETPKVKNISRQMVEHYKEALINGTYDQLTIEKDLLMKRFHKIAARKIYPLGKEFPPRGGCFPGRRKLFVDTQGKYFMCEKVCGNFEIGDVDNGFDHEKIYRFYQEYDRLFGDCKDCWALRLCNKCFNDIRRGH